MASTFSYNDAVLVISLLYHGVDMQYQWHEFEYCKWPMHRWLPASYMFIFAFRLIHGLGTMHAAAGSGDFLLNLRHKGTLPRLLMSLTWLCVLPLFALWTLIGTYWLYDSRKSSRLCLPMGMPLIFIITWQALSYCWVFIHTTLGAFAWVLECRVRQTEDSLRAMEDGDVLERWGHVGQLSGYTALENDSLDGLTPEQIKELPEIRASELSLSHGAECSICLTDLRPADNLRQLASCGHTFHRSCIDLWLLRRADCPLCKRSILGSSDPPAFKSEIVHRNV
jgi:hypothetical protein